MRVHITITDDNGDTYDGTADLTKTTTKSTKVKKVHKTNQPKTITGPADAITNLYSSGFFKEAKTRHDVVTKLSDMGYNFEPDTVSVALHRAKYLNKKGPKGNLVFVQKYPRAEGCVVDRPFN